jgi:hypothetical protein
MRKKSINNIGSIDNITFLKVKKEVEQISKCQDILQTFDKNGDLYQSFVETLGVSKELNDKMYALIYELEEELSNKHLQLSKLLKSKK